MDDHSKARKNRELLKIFRRNLDLKEGIRICGYNFFLFQDYYNEAAKSLADSEFFSFEGDRINALHYISEMGKGITHLDGEPGLVLPLDQVDDFRDSFESGHYDEIPKQIRIDDPLFRWRGESLALFHRQFEIDFGREHRERQRWGFYESPRILRFQFDQTIYDVNEHAFNAFIRRAKENLELCKRWDTQFKHPREAVFPMYELIEGGSFVFRDLSKSHTSRKHFWEVKNNDQLYLASDGWLFVIQRSDRKSEGHLPPYVATCYPHRLGSSEEFLTLSEAQDKGLLR